MKLTGIVQLDELVNPLRRDWVVEFYGDEGLVLKIMHYILAYRSVDEQVYVVLNIEFGGIDTLYFTKLCRLFNCRLDNIYITRSFSLDTTISILEELLNTDNSLVILVYPYNYLPNNPLKYSEATRITGLISRIASKNQVILLNTISRYGYYRPEGGNLHHHLVKVIVRITRRRNTVVAELIKHPAKQNTKRVFTDKTLFLPIKKTLSKTIIDWLAEKTQVKTFIAQY